MTAKRTGKLSFHKGVMAQLSTMVVASGMPEHEEENIYLQKISAYSCHVVGLLEKTFPVELPAMISSGFFDAMPDVHVGCVPGFQHLSSLGHHVFSSFRRLLEDCSDVDTSFHL